MLNLMLNEDISTECPDKYSDSTLATATLEKEAVIVHVFNRSKSPKSADILAALNIEMVFVQGGTFRMGCTAEQCEEEEIWDDETPVHQVTLDSFHIGKYEVSQAQWLAVMGNNPSAFKGDNLPVEYVSWKLVQEFIRKLNLLTGKQYRLPTEAEWEYAARGGSHSIGYKYSGSNVLTNVAWYMANSRINPNPIGTKLPNELGIYDMSGNVWEWCNDWYGNYPSDAQTNPQGPSSGYCRVSRGGYWLGPAWCCRVADRNCLNPDDRGSDIGFRLVHS